MGLVFNPWGALSLAAGALALALAGLIYFTSPGRTANRRLALVLLVEGLLVGSLGAMFSADNPDDAVRARAVNVSATLFLPVLYLYFLATLDTPLVAWIRRRPAELALGAFGLAAQAWWLLQPHHFIKRPHPEFYAQWDVGFNFAYAWFAELSALVLLFALAAAISARRRAVTENAKKRARAYTVAFATRDLLYLFVILIVVILPLPHEGPLDTLNDLTFLLALPAAVLLFVPLMGYGILKTQLFDLDLRMKTLLRAGAFSFLLLLVIALLGYAATLVFPRLGTPLLLSGAALVSLAAVPALRPISARAAEHLMPHVSRSPEYVERRKLEVYRAALEDALTRGTPPRDQAFLDELRRRLGLSKDAAHILGLLVRAETRIHRPSAPTPMAQRFRVERELGRGRFGRALLARDAVLDRPVVLKQPIAPWLLGEEGRKAFLTEARVAARINHPNVVAVHEVLSDEEPPTLVLEYVEGGSLDDRLRRQGRLDLDESLRLAQDVLAGLSEIHRHGVVHRDLKPSYILLAADGRAKITDFGVARPPPGIEDTVPLVSPSAQPGSLGYMSPEQARGESADDRSDLYATGALLYRCLTGRHYLALEGEPEHRVRAAIEASPPRLPAPEVPRAVAAVISKALQKEAARRFATAREMAKALAQAVPTTRSPKGAP